MYNANGDKIELDFGEMLTISNSLVFTIKSKAQRIVELKKEYADLACYVDESENLFPGAEKESLDESVEANMNAIEKSLALLKKVDESKYYEVKEYVDNTVL